MAATLVAFVVVRVGIAQLVRSHYVAPLMKTTHDLNAVGSQADPTAWWLGFPNYYDSTGAPPRQSARSRHWPAELRDSVLPAGRSVLGIRNDRGIDPYRARVADPWLRRLLDHATRELNLLGANPGDLVPEMYRRPPAGVKALKIEPFVRRVREAVRQDKAHQQAGGLE